MTGLVLPNRTDVDEISPPLLQQPFELVTRHQLLSISTPEGFTGDLAHLCQSRLRSGSER